MHAGEDVVGRAVEDAGEGLHFIDPADPAEFMHPWDAAAGAGFIEDAGMMGFRRRAQVLIKRGHHLLVAGDRGLSGFQSLMHKGMSRLQPAHAFRNGVDFRILQDFLSGQGHARVADLRLILNQNLHNFQTAQRFAAAAVNDLTHAAADHAVSKQSDLHMGSPLMCLCTKYTCIRNVNIVS
jgi:hypothetical protein